MSIIDIMFWLKSIILLFVLSLSHLYYVSFSCLQLDWILFYVPFYLLCWLTAIISVCLFILGSALQFITTHPCHSPHSSPTVPLQVCTWTLQEYTSISPHPTFVLFYCHLLCIYICYKAHSFSSHDKISLIWASFWMQEVKLLGNSLILLPLVFKICLSRPG